MAGAKRASMRDGPLAALFRGTTEDSLAENTQESAEPKQGGSAQSTLGPATIGAQRTLQDPPAPRTARPAEERLRSVFSAEIPYIPSTTTPKSLQSDADPPEAGSEQGALLRVVGIGGAGVNALNRMIEGGVEGPEFIAINTDAQSLEHSRAHQRVHIGKNLTRGLGSGADPEIGRQAATEEYDRIKSTLKGSDMIFITAGAGGGTGTGAAPIVARIAREVGAVTVGVVTKPFAFEGSRRSRQAEAGVHELSGEVHTLIVIPNSRLLAVLNKKISMVDAFKVADDVLRQGVQGISDLIMLPGLINLDFADVRTVMSTPGKALLGIGMGAGEQRAVQAAEHAVSSPLLETSVEGARSILLSITGGRDLSLWEVNEAARAVGEAAHPDANIIFGAMIDEKVVDQVWVTVVATGYGDDANRGTSTDGPQRIQRAPTEPAPPQRRTGFETPADDDFELEIPEFIPRR